MIHTCIFITTLCSITFLLAKDLAREDIISPRDLEESILGTKTETASARHDLMHRVRLFRMRLLHFVNNLHAYLMTQVSPKQLNFCVKSGVTHVCMTNEIIYSL